MLDLDLKEKLTRKMKNEDFCHQRIFSTTPLLWKEYSEYMTDSKTCDFKEVFLNLIKDWNIQRNIEILEKYSNKKINEAIQEILNLYNCILDIYDDFLVNSEFNTLKLTKLINMSLDNYKDIAEICQLYTKDYNFSKLLARVRTLAQKTKKALNGVITFDNFIKNEIIPQKEFLDVFVKRLSLFSKDQFCIFLLCYDIKKTNHSIF